MIIQEKYFIGKKPSIAYTDFSAIYLSTSLTGDSLDVARKHECSHIWLQHQTRGKQVLSEKKEINNHLWNIACDMEIAKYIYDDNDEQVIKRPRSLLKGGIIKDSLKGYEDCEFAEDFYEKLLKKQPKTLISFDEKGNAKIEIQKGEKTKKISISKKEIEDIKERIKKEAKKKRQEKMVTESIQNFKAPKPSLASEIDKFLGQYKRDVVKSYRRPNRKESDFLIKGRITKARTPHLTVYLDRSGSFCKSKTDTANHRIKDILKKYRGRITNDVLYFNDNLMSIDPINGGGGTNYQCVVDSIVRNRSQLSIIVTDNDSADGVKFQGVLPKTIVYPIGCTQTDIAKIIKVTEVIK